MHNEKMLDFIKNSKTNESQEKEEKVKKATKNRSTTSLRVKDKKNDKTGSKAKDQPVVVPAKQQDNGESYIEEARGESQLVSTSKYAEKKSEDKAAIIDGFVDPNLEDKKTDILSQEKSSNLNKEDDLRENERTDNDMAVREETVNHKTDFVEDNSKMELENNEMDGAEELPDNLMELSNAKEDKSSENTVINNAEEDNFDRLGSNLKSLDSKSKIEKQQCDYDKRELADEESNSSSDSEDDQMDFKPMKPKKESNKAKIKQKKGKKATKVAKFVEKETKTNVIAFKQKGKSPKPSKTKKSMGVKKLGSPNQTELPKASNAGEVHTPKQDNGLACTRKSTQTHIVINLKKSKANKKIVYKVKSVDGLEETDEDLLKKRQKMTEKQKNKKTNTKCVEEAAKPDLSAPVKVLIQDILSENGKLYTRRISYNADNAIIRDEKLDLRRALEEDMSITFKMLEEEVLDMSSKLGTIIDRHNEIWKVLHS